MAATSTRPLTVALVDDYDVVLVGLAHMFDSYSDRVVVAEIDATTELSDTVDIVMYDSFAQPESDHDEISALVASPRAGKVVMYTWNFHPDLVAGRSSRVCTDTCRRRSPPANWWRRSSASMPARW